MVLAPEVIFLAGAAALSMVAAVFVVVVVLDRRHWRAALGVHPEAFWKAYLIEPPTAVDHRLGRAVVEHTHATQFCKRCFAPFSGALAPVVRPLGHGPAPSSTDFCRRCAAHLPLGGAEAEITVLFAEVRLTTMAEQASGRELAAVLERCYGTLVPVLVRHGALVTKLVGSQVMALFTPALCGDDHAQRALEAGAAVLWAGVADTQVGVGVHSGEVFVGVIGIPGRATELSAVGNAVSVAARLAAEAAAGELLYTQRTVELCSAPPAGADEPELVRVRGTRETVAVLSMRVDQQPARRGGQRRRTPPGPSFGWSSLTAAELEVATLVAEGLTNRDVARRLMMSRHTVDSHLRRIFSKVRVRSRAALAAEFARREVDEQVAPK